MKDKLKENMTDKLADKKIDETAIREMARRKEIAQYYVHSKLDRKLLIMQLAEESAELSQACLKYLRALDGTNLCAEQDQEVYMDNIVEEYSDVANVAEVACIHLDYEIIANKAERWADRLKALEERKGANYE